MAQNIRIKNNLAPDLSPGGDPTPEQLAKEYSYLFTKVTRGLGLPYQLSRFLFALNTICKAGELYQWNDEILAETIGREGVSRNYICNLRRALREWQGAEYESGRRHPIFVQVEENNYNRTLKKQIPTGYIVSLEFKELLESIWSKVHTSQYYPYNWLKAVSEVLDSNKLQLEAFGVWRERKQKRPRDPEKIAGTLWLIWERSASRLINFHVEQGYDPDWIIGEMGRQFPVMAARLKSESLLVYKPRIRVADKENNLIDSFPVKGSRADFNGFMILVRAYIESRKNPIEENQNYAGSFGKQSTISRAPGNNNSIAYVPTILDDSTLAESLQKVSGNKSLDNARNRFLRRNQTG